MQVMDHIISAGVVVYRCNNALREYLLIRNRKRHWDFPKGKQESGESTVQTALRELREETGLVIEYVTGPLSPISWIFKENNVLYQKLGVLYLGCVGLDADVCLSAEHTDFVWLPYEEALKKLQHETSRRLLTEAHQTLDQSERSDCA